MNEIPSTTFRKVYAKLSEPTAVTVNGHVIGEWRPTAIRQLLAYAEAEDIPMTLMTRDDGSYARGTDFDRPRPHPEHGYTAAGFGERNPSREFNPVPKPVKRGK